jgi:hypothetical protein
LQFCAVAMLGIAVHEMPQPLPQPYERTVLEHLGGEVVVDAEQQQELREVRSLPLTAQVGLRDPDVAAADEALGESEIPDEHHRLRPRLEAAEPQTAAVGKPHLQGAAVQPRCKRQCEPCHQRQAGEGLARGRRVDRDGFAHDATPPGPLPCRPPAGHPPFDVEPKLVARLPPVVSGYARQFSVSFHMRGRRQGGEWRIGGAQLVPCRPRWPVRLIVASIAGRAGEPSPAVHELVRKPLSFE